MRGDSSRSDLVEFRTYSRGVYSGKRLTEMAIFTSPDRDMVARLLSDYNGSYFERNGFTSHGIARDQDHQLSSPDTDLETHCVTFELVTCPCMSLSQKNQNYGGRVD